MTCIVALEYEDKVFMGGDSASTEEWNIHLITTPKILRSQNLLIGYTWSFRMGQIIQYASDLPEMYEHQSNYAYLIQSFIPFIRKTFADAGWLKTVDSRDEGGQFLVGIRGEIYTVESDFSVLRTIDGFNSIGCGSPYALGALRILKYSGKIREDPMMAVGLALETAAYFSNGVSGPFIYETLERKWYD